MDTSNYTKLYLCPDNVDSSLYRDGNVDTFTYLNPWLANVDTSLYTVELRINTLNTKKLLSKQCGYTSI